MSFNELAYPFVSKYIQLYTDNITCIQLISPRFKMIKKKDVLFQDYSNLLTEIKQRINKAQYEALKVVNRELIVLYWDMGKLIFQYLQTGSWGDSLINKLAHDLQKTFPGARGYSARNLRYIVDFYSNYKENAKLQSLIAKISWTHNIILLDRCSDILEREFYKKTNTGISNKGFSLRKQRTDSIILVYRSRNC